MKSLYHSFSSSYIDGTGKLKQFLNCARRAKDTLIRKAKRRLVEIEVDYSCRYIAASVSKPSLNLIKESGYRIERLPDVIQTEILPGIVVWKKKLTGTKSLPTIPNNLWFIAFLDYLARALY